MAMEEDFTLPAAPAPVSLFTATGELEVMHEDVYEDAPEDDEPEDEVQQ